MSRVKIFNGNAELPEPADPTDRFYESEVFYGYGTTIRLDGKEIRNVKSISLSKIEMDEPLRVTVEVIVTEQIDVELAASAQVSFVAPDGFTIEETPLPNGGRRIRALAVDTVSG